MRSDPVSERPGGRVPNTSTSEDQWREAMRWFPDGMTDGEIAQRLRVSWSTVCAQRRTRGVTRSQRAGPPRLGPEPVELPEAEALPPAPELRAAQRAPGLRALEDQMLLLGAGAGAERGRASPDRAHALV